jgi:hypothetical protein
MQGRYIHPVVAGQKGPANGNRAFSNVSSRLDPS